MMPSDAFTPTVFDNCGVEVWDNRVTRKVKPTLAGLKPYE